MAFGMGLFRNLLTRNNLQRPQAQIGAMSPQNPGNSRRAVQQEAGGGAIGGMGMPAPGSQPPDGMEMASGRPSGLIEAPGSMAEINGIADLQNSVANQPKDSLPSSYSRMIVPGIPLQPPGVGYTYREDQNQEGQDFSRPTLMRRQHATGFSDEMGGFQELDRSIQSQVRSLPRSPNTTITRRPSMPDRTDEILSISRGYRPGYQDKPYADLITAKANQYGVDPNILAGMIQQESGFNPKATGPDTRYGRAQGLAQIIPSTQRELGVTNPYDPEQSIDAGSRYLSGLTGQFGGDTNLALAGYNAGPTLVSNMLKRGRVSGTDLSNLPRETQGYIPAINENAQRFASLATPAATPEELRRFTLDAASQLPQTGQSQEIPYRPDLNSISAVDPNRYGVGPSNPAYFEQPLSPQELEQEALMKALKERAAASEAEDRQLLKEQPVASDARKTADDEVRQKGKLWRLGQVGLGALKGFVGVNPNGGSGILGALSGAVSGGTGDLYRMNRIGGIREKEAMDTQAWKEKVNATNILKDNSRQMDQVVLQGIKNEAAIDKQKADIEAQRQRGEISEERAKTANAELDRKRYEFQQEQILAYAKLAQQQQIANDQIAAANQRAKEAEAGKKERHETPQPKPESGAEITKTQTIRAKGAYSDLLINILGDHDDDEPTGKTYGKGKKQRQETYGELKAALRAEMESSGIKDKILENIRLDRDPYEGVPERFLPKAKKQARTQQKPVVPFNNYQYNPIQPSAQRSKRFGL